MSYEELKSQLASGETEQVYVAAKPPKKGMFLQLFLGGTLSLVVCAVTLFCMNNPELFEAKPKKSRQAIAKEKAKKTIDWLFSNSKYGSKSKAYEELNVRRSRNSERFQRSTRNNFSNSY